MTAPPDELAEMADECAGGRAACRHPHDDGGGEDCGDEPTGSGATVHVDADVVNAIGCAIAGIQQQVPRLQRGAVGQVGKGGPDRLGLLRDGETDAGVGETRNQQTIPYPGCPQRARQRRRLAQCLDLDHWSRTRPRTCDRCSRSPVAS